MAGAIGKRDGASEKRMGHGTEKTGMDGKDGTGMGKGRRGVVNGP